MSRYRTFVGLTLVLLSSACNLQRQEPIEGPDKQGEGMVYGMMMGAGSGAIMGAQYGMATGPGAVIGMGFGGVAGMLSGLGLDIFEDNQLENAQELKELREAAWAQEMISQHYDRRLELHPSRDIYPADWFFADDTATLSCSGEILIREIVKMNRSRMPWSRLVISSYSVAFDEKSTYARYLNKKTV